MTNISRPFSLALIAAIPLLGCAQGEARQTPDSAAPAAEAVATADSRSLSPTALHFVVSPTGTAARYRVRERLVGHDLPSDAVGETKNVTGALDIDSTGKVIPQTSKITLDAGSFVSDQDRRDGYVRRRLLEADQYPTIVFVPTVVRGVALPLPTSGTRPFVMMGDLTVRGVTRPTEWKGTATFASGGITGSAATLFTFEDIKLDQPRVPVLLSVADTIRLEVDFALVRQR